MSERFFGEIRLMAFGVVPSGWAACNGQTLSIAQNQALFTLLGTTYGGDGVSTFRLPDLRGRAPVDDGDSPGGQYVMGQAAGRETHALTVAEMPQHVHQIRATSADADAGTTPVPPGSTTVPAQTYAVRPNGNTVPVKRYSTAQPNVPLAASTIGTSGNSQPHQNMQPYLAMNFCIALSGRFPSRQ